MSSPANSSANRSILGSLQQISTPETLRILTMPEPPPDFGAVGKAHFYHYCGIYLKLGNMSISWLPVIINICRLHDYMGTIQEALDEQGTMILTFENGAPRSRINPLFKDYLKAASQLQRMLGDLGMTPYTARVSQINMSTPSDLSPRNGSKPAIAAPARG